MLYLVLLFESKTWRLWKQTAECVRKCSKQTLTWDKCEKKHINNSIFHRVLEPTSHRSRKVALVQERSLRSHFSHDGYWTLNFSILPTQQKPQNGLFQRGFCRTKHSRESTWRFSVHISFIHLFFASNKKRTKRKNSTIVVVTDYRDERWNWPAGVKSYRKLVRCARANMLPRS